MCEIVCTAISSSSVISSYEKTSALITRITNNKQGGNREKLKNKL